MMMHVSAVLLGSVLAFFNFTPLTWPEVDAMIARDFPGTPEISTGQLAELIDCQSEVVILDVREKVEFQVSHIPHALQTPNLAAVRKIVPERSTRVVVYCSVGYRSARMVNRLREIGYAEAVNLKGSIFKWANEGRPVFQGTQPVRGVHPYNKKWGGLLHRDLWSFE
jgi:rhodanese-related sulfurtransferase